MEMRRVSRLSLTGDEGGFGSKRESLSCGRMSGFAGCGQAVAYALANFVPTATNAISACLSGRAMWLLCRADNVGAKAFSIRLRLFWFGRKLSVAIQLLVDAMRFIVTLLPVLLGLLCPAVALELVRVNEHVWAIIGELGQRSPTNLGKQCDIRRDIDQQRNRARRPRRNREGGCCHRRGASTNFRPLGRRGHKHGWSGS
jgi:hypothetical protein